MIGALGTTSVLVGTATAVWLAGAAAAVWRGRGGIARLRVPVLVLAACAVLAMAALEVGLLTDDFSIRYVAENSARSTPLVFKIATAWASLEGSIVLWGLVLVGYLVAVWRRIGPGDRLGVGALAVMALVAVFFFGLMATVANPFVPVSPVPADGPGPNPLLQNHLLMAVHPPVLYLGYVGFTVPFAFGLSALATGDAGRAWLDRTRRSALVAWSFLTTGILLGGWWSYEVLGWGGYWAWDPVENASFLPWLTGTAFIHSAVAQSRRGMLRAWNVLLVIVTFSLTILGTFLTRSGVVSSVHSFTQSAVGPALLGFLGVVVVASLVLVGARMHVVSSHRRLDSFLSREGAFLVNNLLLSVFAFAVLLGTLYPVLVEAATGTQVSVGRPFFDRVAVPLALALVGAMAVGPLLSYRATDPGRLWAVARVPLLVGLLAAVVAVLAFGVNGWVAVVVVLAVFVLISTGRLLGDAVADVPGSRVRALGRAVRRRPGFWGGQVAHVGLVFVALAIAMSSNLSSHEVVELDRGGRAQVGDLELRDVGRIDRREALRDISGVRVELRQDGRRLEVLEPTLNLYRRQQQAIGTPSVRSTWEGDTYLALRRLDDDVASLDVYRYPFMWLLWVSGIVTALGGLLALGGRRGRRPSRGPSSPSRRADEPAEEVVPLG